MMVWVLLIDTFHGQELVDAVDRVVGDAFEDVVEIELGVEAVKFG